MDRIPTKIKRKIHAFFTLVSGFGDTTYKYLSDIATRSFISCYFY